MEGLISREATYETLTDYYHQRTEIQHKALREALNRVPSAEPEADRLRELCRSYERTINTLVGALTAKTGRFVDWCNWYQGKWTEWTDDTVSEVRNVIAWCKPIEPYKGVTE